jgi:hypothetical protein
MSIECKILLAENIKIAAANRTAVARLAEGEFFF